MTTREARTELKQLRTLRSRISDRKRRIEELRCSIQNARISRYGANGGAKDEYKLERAIDTLTEIESKLLEEIPQLELLRSEIADKIDRVPYPYGRYLTERYIFGKSFEDIAKMSEFCRYAYGGLRSVEIRAVQKYAQLES